MNIYATSDLHFHHKKILEYESRPFSSIAEMNETLIENWNQLVKPEDTIYIIGDFSFGREQETQNLLERLKGKKHLIFGNHDKLSPKCLSKFESSSIYRELKYKGHTFVMFHYPIYSWNKKHHGSIHLHGHTHSRPMEFKHPNLINVGVDVQNFRPINLDDILIGRNASEKPTSRNEV